MKKTTVWMVAAALAGAVAGCGDGSVRSPGLLPRTVVEDLRIEPASVETPVGTSVELRAIATLASTPPKGTPDADIDDDGLVRSTEDVTSQADWSSRHTSIATVSGGTVTGVSRGSTTIAAEYEGVRAEAPAVINDAVLQGVDFIKPFGEERAPDDRYGTVTDASVRFEIFGSFSDGETRALNPAAFEIRWSSDDPLIADNPDEAAPSRFQGISPGEAVIVGEVLGEPGISPASAAATLAVETLSTVCEAEFAAPQAIVVTDASAGCIGCLVEQPGAIIDGNEESYATMRIPLGLLGLLGGSVSATISDPGTPRLEVGRPAAFLVSRTASLLSLELLSSVRITTVTCDVNGENCTDGESFDDSTGALKLSLLGLIGDQDVSLLSTPPLGAESAGANGLRFDFLGGLLSAAAELNVHTACAVERREP